MPVLSHRGYWKTPDEKNQSIAFRRSFDLGFGTETDLRDYHGDVVIAHDPATGSEMKLRQLLEIMDGRNLPLALNIKADGLSDQIYRILNEFKHDNYFTFDMSIPELYRQIRTGLNTVTGVSEFQIDPPMLDQCKGIWLDCFRSVWYGSELIDDYIKRGFSVSVVSSELHNRPFDDHWGMLKKMDYLKNDKFFVCTDFPEQAREFLGI